MKLNSKSNMYRIIVTLIISIAISIFLIYLVDESPMSVINELIHGAFGSRLRFGTTLAMVTPLLLTSTAFALAAKTGVYNVGVEGCVFLGGLASAYIGINWTFLPRYLLIVVCMLVACAIGALWSFIPAYLKTRYNVNEITVTILMNTVAVYITSYFVSGPMSSGTAVPQTHPVNESLTKLLSPSNANTGIFIAILVIIIAHYMIERTKFGYKIKSSGSNALFTDYSGLNSKQVVMLTFMLSGAIGGLAGAIEVLGVHGMFIDNFAKGMGTNGMLISLVSSNNLMVIPFVSFLVGALNSGGQSIQITTNVPRSMIDTIIAVIILIATMDTLGIKTKTLLSDLVKRFTKSGGTDNGMG